MKEHLKKHLKTYLASSFISLTIGVIIFLLYFLINGKTMYAAINASSISAVVLLGFGGLMYVASEGFFDVFSYGVKQVGSSIFGKKGNENNDFVGYKEQKRIKRESKAKIFISFLISGLLFLIVLIVLKIIGI